MSVLFKNAYDVVQYIYENFQHLFKPNGNGYLFATCIPAEFASEFKLFPFANSGVVDIPELDVKHVLDILSKGKGGAVNHISAAMNSAATEAEYQADYDKYAVTNPSELHNKYGIINIMGATIAVHKERLAQALRIPLRATNFRKVSTVLLEEGDRTIYAMYTNDGVENIPEEKMELFVDLANKRATSPFDVGRGFFLSETISMRSILEHPLFMQAMSVYPVGSAVKIWRDLDNRVYAGI